MNGGVSAWKELSDYLYAIEGDGIIQHYREYSEWEMAVAENLALIRLRDRMTDSIRSVVTDFMNEHPAHSPIARSIHRSLWREETM